jgi:hypothetical protein
MIQQFGRPFHLLTDVRTNAEKHRWVLHLNLPEKTFKSCDLVKVS